MTDSSRGSEAGKYRITRSRLEGTVRVSGAKNSVLRLLAASLLTEERVQLLNYPSDLLDARVHVGMLEALGKTCVLESPSVLTISGAAATQQLDWNSRSIRNTLLILGALVSRYGAGRVPLPGGCQLGERKYDLHELVLRTLGARVWEEDGNLCAEAPGGLTGADIHLPIRSTGATENAILCGVLAHGRTRIWNPHVRPEILDLIRLLNSMGARIEVFGQEHIQVDGVDTLAGTAHRVIPDNMEALTWLIGSVMTGGDVEILEFPFDDLEVPLVHLRESGARMYRASDRMIVRGGRCYPVEISTGPFPGINSDMQPLFAVYGCTARGESRIVDLRFPDRYDYAQELAKMGADVHVRNNVLRINGGTPLHGTEVEAVDLRAGIALALAGLTADGTTTITSAWQVERGYSQFVGKLRALGGTIDVDS